MNRNRILILVAVILGLFIIGLIATRSTYNPKAPREPETATAPGQPGVSINNAGGLADILLNQQFIAVRTNLASYVQTKYPSAKSATVTDEPTVANDGSISFHLQIDGANKTVAVRIDRLPNGVVTVAVPTDNYQSTVQVYSSGSD
ncbi:MAG TPA: hypothetical protein VLE72_02715 [Candidatus Saccharimonadales bacterium]|nr:hypothetical protein [Candidatus Saccharimonadales bacterium]